MSNKKHNDRHPSKECSSWTLLKVGIIKLKPATLSLSYRFWRVVKPSKAQNCTFEKSLHCISYWLSAMFVK